MDWLELVKAITPIVSLYIAFLTYRMNKRENERKRKKETEQEDSKKDASSLPPRRTKHPKR